MARGQTGTAQRSGSRSASRSGTARSSAARTGRGSSTGRGSRGGRSSGSRGGATRQRRGDRGEEAASLLLPGQGRHVWGVVCCLLAALAALALWFTAAAGSVGVVVERAVRGALGAPGLAVPLAFALVGIVLLREPAHEHRRLGVGGALVGVALAGIWHVAAGAPGPDALPETLRRAGGWLLAAAVTPLAGLVGIAGVVVLLLGMCAVGLMLVTATPPRVVGEHVGAAVVGFVGTVRESLERRRLAREAAREEAEAGLREAGAVDDDDAAADDDEAAADDTEARSGRTRRRGRGRDVTEIAGRAAGSTRAGDHELAAEPAAEPAAEETIEVVYEGVEERLGVDAPTTRLDGEEGATSAAQAAGDASGSGAAEDPGGARGARGKGARSKAAGDEGAGGATGALARPIGPPLADAPAYELPSLELLTGGKVAAGNRRALEQMRTALERTLSQFGVDAAVSRITRGPTVTRFELTLGPGVKVSAVTKLSDDVSYALATPEIRIVAPIPGKSAIGIEVPNREKDTITLGDVLRSPEGLAATHPLTVGIGVDIAGKPVLCNLGKMPHVLIAGATGSGKSVTMNAIVTSLVMRTKPSEVKLILVDPKRVELSSYEGVPHLLTSVVTDPKRAKEALDWTVDEMNQRYQRLQLLGYRNLDQYNEAVAAGTVRQPGALSGEAETEWEPLPYIVFVIDELADLMMVAPRDVEGGIVRIAQMARAVGIHLVVATQRPSVDVVTGLIKANVPARIALSMATGHDSKTILDAYGAEKLVGNGDMLYLPANVSKPTRVQGCFVSESEIEAAIAHCKAQLDASYEPGIVRAGQEAVVADVQGDDASDDDLIRAARDLVVRSGLGSTSMLQRKLRIGFARAGRVMDELEQLGVVGPSEGSKARTVFLTVADLEGDDE